ncbi:cytochrome b/b6 domain-containing protein, partial [Aliarcobacter butzleri]|uniref:cytochrome b/b6 domain-containing protein n=1 Tax=Aliarcobacter butzleri TaxID=28197 RepID=UPI003AF5EB9B
CIKQIKYYILIGEHTHLKGVYNPLQFMAYSEIYISLILISLTGWILHNHVYHEGKGGFLYGILRPIEVLMGGLAIVREFHHICMWIFIIFLPIHIYLVVFNTVYGKKG